MRNGKQTVEARKVLLIEGHPHVRTPLEHILQTRGHHVTAVGSAEDGLSAIGNNSHDVAVCNYHLPGMSGIDFFTKSRQFLSGKTTIMTAAFTDNYLADHALALGITVFMEMPFKIENLIACIEGRTPDLCAGSLGRHLYVTSGGRMIAISPTYFDGYTVPPRPSNAPLPKTINLSGRRWKLYLNPDAPQTSLNANGPARLKNRSHGKSGKSLHDLY